MKLILYFHTEICVVIAFSWKDCSSDSANKWLSLYVQVKQGISDEKKLCKSTIQQQDAELKQVGITVRNEYKNAKQQLKKVSCEVFT